MDEWHTNPEVIASAITGDRDALRAVWAEHRRWVAAILLAHKPRQADLEDLLQTVAHNLGVGIDLIYDAIAAGGLKHTRLGHRTIRLRREWIDAWAEEHARQAK